MRLSKLFAASIVLSIGVFHSAFAQQFSIAGFKQVGLPCASDTFIPVAPSGSAMVSAYLACSNLVTLLDAQRLYNKTLEQPTIIVPAGTPATFLGIDSFGNTVTGTPSGGGNVSTSGSITNGNIGVWASPTGLASEPFATPAAAYLQALGTGSLVYCYGSTTAGGAPLYNTCPSGGGGSVSITAGNAGITVSPSPLTGTGAVSLNMTGGGAVSNEWVNSISAAGVATLAQPAFTNLSGSASAGQIATNLGAAVSTLCSASTSNFVRGDGTCVTPGGGGNVSTSGSITNGAFGIWASGTGLAGTIVPGSGVLTALADNVGTAGAFVVNGGALGTPLSGTLTNTTGLPLSSGVIGNLPAANMLALANGDVYVGNGSNQPVATTFATPAAAYLQALGSGSLVYCYGSTTVGGAPLYNTCPSGGSSAFSSLTGGTNTTAAMVVGSGASLAVSGSGTIAATAVPWTGVSSTPTTLSGYGITSPLPVNQGGTGFATFTAGTMPMGAGTSPLTASEITDVASGGVVIGTPTGGQKGPGTINVTGCFINNVACASGSSTAFSAITGGTNTSAAMIIGTGASLATSGSGTIAATSVPATGITGTTTLGSTPLSLGGTTATIAGLTLSSPTIATILNTGTLTLPTSTDTLVGRATTDTLTNKTLTSPTINGGTMGAATAWTISSGTPTTYIGLDASSHMVTGTPAGSGNMTGSGASTTNDVLAANNTGATLNTAIDTGILYTNLVTTTSTQTSGNLVTGGGTKTLGTSLAPTNNDCALGVGGAWAVSTLCDLTNLAQSITAAKTFTNSDILLLGSSTGFTTFTSGNASATNYTLTIPANSGTLAELNLAQTWSAAQSFNNADLLLNGSSSGASTLEAPATGGGVVTLPAGTVTLLAANATTGGPTGSATVAPIITYSGGQLTAVSSATITPAVGSITGLGSGVATALAIAPGTTGSFTTQDGAITTNNCLKWGPGVQDAGVTCGGSGTPVLFVGTTAGGPTAYTAASTTPSGFANTAYYQFCGTFSTANGASPTLNVGSTSALPIQKTVVGGVVALAGGEIVPTSNYCFQLNSSATDWIMQTQPAGGVTVLSTASANHNVTTQEWANFQVFLVTAASQTITVPVVTTLATNGGIFIETIPTITVSLVPNAADGINGNTINTPQTIQANVASLVGTTGSSGVNALQAPLGTSGSSGTVNSGTSGQATYYAGTGTTVSGNANWSYGSTRLLGNYNAGGALPANTNNGLSLGAADNAIASATLYTWGSGVNPNFTAYASGGTLTSPSAVTSGSLLGCFLPTGAISSSAYASAATGICGKAAQTFTGSVNGASLYFFTTPNGTNTSTPQMLLDQNGALLLPPAATNPGANGLAVTGPINVTTDQAVTDTLTISTATFTPVLSSGINQQMTLVHASCPCTIANPTGIASAVGQTGMLDIIQSSTGSDTVGTWGSQYITPGGTSTLTLSTGANAIDHIAYRVIDSTHVLLSPVMLNATH